MAPSHTQLSTVLRALSCGPEWGGAELGHEETLLFVLALAVIPVGVDAQVTELAQLRALAEQGDAEAQYQLGIMYAVGSGVPEDFVESVRWDRLAAEQGHGGAQTSLGFSYRYGRGVPEDDAEAVRWYRLAAEQGNALAQLNLGVMYSNGEGVPQDDAEAARWYRLAAEQGYPRAWTNLGDMYRDGEGVPQDDVLAYMWWNIDADGEAAQQNKALLEERMTREQIDEAQRLTREWLEAHPPGGD